MFCNIAVNVLHKCCKCAVRVLYKCCNSSVESGAIIIRHLFSQVKFKLSCLWPCYYRFRRDVLEGTYEELLETFDDDLDNKNSNYTFSERHKRQADYPGPIESNNSSGK